MANLAVAYQRPNHCLRTLTNELTASHGYPARPYEFVTGYKSSANNSGHCPDNNGVVHGVDIFVGPGNLAEQQGIAVAERLRIEGTRGTIPGHPDRLYYIIHRWMIAGDFTNWQWVAYGGADSHYDHIHVSTADTFWGDPVNLSPADYDSTAPWNLGGSTVAPQASTKPITISKEGFLMALSDADQLELLQNMRKIVGWINTIHTNVAPINTAKGPVPMRQFIADGTRAAQAAAANTASIRRGGKDVSLRQELADVKTSVLKTEPVIVNIAEAVVAETVDK